ncbi:MAG: helix-turn-helix transcriptional regulator [Clostridiales bacterium]|nr:helix-turn-helix transcriptional regulator [Clostridiales bacterium]
MAGNEIKGEMIRGHVDTFILLSLCNGDKDSNEIKEAIEERSDNKFTVKQGTFYSAMQRLVKQNFIKEYRSSAADGIRRKYYSLTEKGKKSLEKNREEWTKSKELIDNLIDTPQQQPQTEKVIIPEVKDEFDEFKKFAEQNAPDYTFLAPDDSDDSYLDRLGSEVLNDLNDELDSLKSGDEGTDVPDVATESDDETPDFTTLLPPDENELVIDASDDDIAAEGLYADTAGEDELTEDKFVYDFELPEQKPEIVESEPGEISTDSDTTNETYIDEKEGIVKSENIENSSINTEENHSDYENVSDNDDNKTVEPEENLTEQNIVKKEQSDEQTSVKKDDREKDDSLYIEDGAPTNRREYKTILGKLFPKNDEPKTKPTNEVQGENRQIDFDEYST